MRATRTKVATTAGLPSPEERAAALADANYNLFGLSSDDVSVDLLTDSGTGAMSDEQWAALMCGDESYAGSRSFDRLEAAVHDVMGFEHVVPAHQGRGAENVLYGCLLEDGDYALNNTHFDTTRGHVANQGATPVDCPVDGAMDPDAPGDFKGNFSVERAREVVDDVGAENVPVVVVTVTNNSAAGQPVSVENVREAREFADEIGATFVIDACRFAENAHFVQRREPGFEDASVVEIAREQLGYADALVMSGKKDAMANVGGFVALRDESLLAPVRERTILYEGFPTYGGLAGRDLEAMAVGLREVVEPPVVADRVAQVEAFGAMFAERGLPVYRPVGGHAVYLDAGEFFPDIPPAEFPGQALACELYLEGAVRGVELGSLAFPGTDRPELLRLAVPRRTYAREHLEHVADAAERVWERREEVTGYEIVHEPELTELRHFSAALRPLE